MDPRIQQNLHNFPQNDFVICKNTSKAENKIDHGMVMMISDLGEIWNVFYVIASNIVSILFHLEVKDLTMALAGLPND